jgi:ABC-type enterobactin transport system permease subunit
MQMAITFIAVVAGMIFSLAVALLAEELIFGQVFRLFIASGNRPAHGVNMKEAPKN